MLTSSTYLQLPRRIKKKQQQPCILSRSNSKPKAIKLKVLHFPTDFHCKTSSPTPEKNIS